MKKFLGFMLMPALACGIALAQSNMSSGTTAQTNDQMNNGKTKTMEGCVQERDGNYFLMNKKHKKGVELMNSDDVKAQVGHKVSVTGTESAGTATKHHATTDSEDPMGTTHDSGQDADRLYKVQALNVTGIQSLAGTCDMK
jgi:hypothetical protein